jgi:hypothetical protein
MTPTLGDLLTIAGQRIAAAEQHRDPLPAAAHAEVTADLDRPLAVIARHASDGLNPGAAAAMTSPVPTRQELTIIGIRLTLLHGAESIHRVAQTDGHRASTCHAVAADLPRCNNWPSWPRRGEGRPLRLARRAGHRASGAAASARACKGEKPFDDSNLPALT